MKFEVQSLRFEVEKELVMAIGVETIAVNRYAPQGADAISL